MTDYKSVLKSNIQSVELNKKNVKITCANGNSGNLVITTITQNSNTLTDGTFDIAKGIDGAKDFKVKFDGKDAKDKTQAFYEKITDIIQDSSVPVVLPEQSKIKNAINSIKNTVQQVVGGGTAPSAAPSAAPTSAPTSAPDATSVPETATEYYEEEEVASSSNSKMFIIGGAVILLVLVIVLVIWKKKK